MTNYRGLEAQFLDGFCLRRRPVAIAFRDVAPPGVARFRGPEPSGCSFWRIAAGGRTFYTVPSDHYNCPIGGHTHGIPLPPDRAEGLTQTLGFMAGIGYMKMEEVPTIPQLPPTPGVVIYSPALSTE